jgi:hypothetical protein
VEGTPYQKHGTLYLHNILQPVQNSFQCEVLCDICEALVKVIHPLSLVLNQGGFKTSDTRIQPMRHVTVKLTHVRDLIKFC